MHLIHNFHYNARTETQLLVELESSMKFAMQFSKVISTKMQNKTHTKSESNLEQCVVLWRNWLAQNKNKNGYIGQNCMQKCTLEENPCKNAG